MMNTKINIRLSIEHARNWLRENRASVITGAVTTFLLIITAHTTGPTLTAHFWQRSATAPVVIRQSIELPTPPQEPEPEPVAVIKPIPIALVIEDQQSSTASSSSSSAYQTTESVRSAAPPSQASTSSQASTPTTPNSQLPTPTAQSSESSESSQSSNPNPISDFPPLGNAVHPVTRVPNWGAMRSPAEWNRTYNQMADEDFVSIPRYNMSILTTPMESLIKPLRDENIPLITAKLYYSTRHMGTYDLDADEHTGTHPGVDLKLALGTPIGTIAGGRVIQTGRDFLLGNYVFIEHRIPNEGIYISIYGHLDVISVKEGQDVISGQMIGTVGMTGSTSGPHLHLQVDRDDGTRPYARYHDEYSTADAANRTVHPIEFIRRY